MSESFEEVGMAEDASEELMYGFDCGVPLYPPPLGHQRSASMRLEDPDSPPMYRSMAQGSGSAMLDDGYDDVPVYRSIAGVGCLGVATHAVVDHALEEEVTCRGFAGYGHASIWGQLGRSASADSLEAAYLETGRMQPVLRALIAGEIYQAGGVTDGKRQDHMKVPARKMLCTALYIYIYT